MNFSFPSLSDCLRILKDVLTWLTSAVESWKWALVKFSPLFAIPVFFMSASLALLSNDAAWAKYVEVQGVISGHQGTAQSAAAVWFARMNYVFPIAELFHITYGLFQLLFICTVIRAVKSFIPTLT